MTQYLDLGRSGLRVSPLCLGTMTFGTDWGWGADEATCGQILDAYLAAGGNFVDTADLYTGGKSEEICGRLIRDRSLRDRVVLATKYSFNAQPGNPNAGGNGRKNLYRALEGSLRRLQTDYIDLYWMHLWDGTTPVEEVMASMNDLVRPARFAISDSRMCLRGTRRRASGTIAQFAHSEPAIALQLGDAFWWSAISSASMSARHWKLGTLARGVPWRGFLAGKVQARRKRPRDRWKQSGWVRQSVGSRSARSAIGGILDVLLDAAKEIGRPPAEVALNWVATQRGVSSTIIGRRPR